jgi:Kef-type K+ transport system membrane component KefB
MTLLLALSLSMAIGLLFTRIAKKVNLPNVTAYLVAGLLIGPSVFGLMNDEMMDATNILVTCALGFIAFSIGGEFKLTNLKRIGTSAIIITLFQALTASILVTLVLTLLGFDFAESLMLGAIATATAPAATLMVVRQYKAKGPVTNVLLPVVAIDDAIGLFVFSICLSIAETIVAGAAFSVKTALFEPFLEIVLSLVIGAALGFALSFGMKLFKSRANRITLTVAIVLIGTALADMYDLSSLLLCMAIGAIFCNTSGECDKVLDLNERWTQPLLLVFFVLSGAEINLSIVPTVGILGIAYILARSLGKYLGALAGATVVHADKNIRKYLGITLLPQAGVAIGMSQIVLTRLPEYGTRIQAVVLCATLVYELVGPLLTKIVLTKAGEIEPTGKKSLSKN